MTASKWHNGQILRPGDLVHSICGGFIYEILSHPFCRIYYDYAENASYLLSYHAMEGLTAQDRQRGLKRPHLSYLAKIHSSTLLCNGSASLFCVTDNGLKFIRSINGIENARIDQRLSQFSETFSFY
jgi:hypothetical protein